MSTEIFGPVKPSQESRHIASAHNGEAAFPPDIKEQLPLLITRNNQKNEIELLTWRNINLKDISDLHMISFRRTVTYKHL